LNELNELVCIGNWKEPVRGSAEDRTPAAGNMSTAPDKVLWMKVMDPNDRVVYQQSAKAKGTFGFTAEHAGDYKACFTCRGEPLTWEMVC
jgi:hypothetical protein